MRTLIAAVASTLFLLGLRLDLAVHVGLTDAEALTLAYGLHPAPAYVDHPGFSGWLAGVLGPLGSPSRLHVITAIASAALPWAGVLAARACGAGWQAALRTYFGLALVPALGLRSWLFLPELPLAWAWVACLGFGGWALRHPAHRFGTLVATLAAALAAAVASVSMYMGFGLALGLAWALVRSEGRLRTLAFWGAAACYVIFVAPLATHWLQRGRDLYDLTPAGLAGLGDVAWPVVLVTPPFLYAGALVLRERSTRASTAPVTRLLTSSTLFSVVPAGLAAAVLGAAPGSDWLAPAYLGLSLQLALVPGLPPRVSRTCLATGVALALGGWAWLRTPLPLGVARALGGSGASLEAAADVYAWEPGRDLLQQSVASVRQRTGQTPFVVGPHWAVCAQAELALGGAAPVGCETIQRDDYDNWLPARVWAEGRTILFVTDSRFHEAPPETFYGRTARSTRSRDVQRFGVTVRTLSVSEFEREEATAQAVDACTDMPARSSNARSSSVSGFGVVSSLSP